MAALGLGGWPDEPSATDKRLRNGWAAQALVGVRQG